MPTERFRDPDTGRWVTRETAAGPGQFLRELFSGRVRESQELVEEGRAYREYGEIALPNWITEGTRWGERWVAGPDPLSVDALSEAEPPFEADAYWIRYRVPNNPDYPRGYGSTEALSIAQWPPDPSLWEPVGGTGIDSIYFRYT